MNKESERQISQTLSQIAKPWLKRDLPFPGSLLTELIRDTGLPARDLKKAILSGKIVVTVNGASFQAQINTPNMKPVVVQLSPIALTENDEGKAKIENSWQDKFDIQKQILEFLTKSAGTKGLIPQPEVLKRLAFNVENKTAQPLVIIWGPPYANQTYQADLFAPNSPEGIFKQQLAPLLNAFSDFGIELLPLILYADVYGTEINQLNPAIVNYYGQRIEQEFNSETFFTSWSNLRNQNWERYNALKDLVNARYSGPTQESLNRAQQMLVRLGQSVNSQTVYNQAKNYECERLIEGQMLTEGFRFDGYLLNNVIKLGTARSPENDNVYEPNLPRIYVKNLPRTVWSQRR